MTDQVKNLSVFDVFAASQETFEEAKKKSSEESGKKVKYLRFSQDGTYAVRILPLAPIIDADGNVLPPDRKGYEYPLRSLMLKIEDTKKDDKGKPKISYVTVCNARYAFPNLESDLIDTYVKVACDLYQDDEKLCKKLRDTSFNGGLKWDSRRCMYVIDCEKPGDGIQILQLSYSQYKELEERKLNLWNKLNKNGKNVPCPISSIANAYPLEVTRKTENKKVDYSFNIDTISGENELDEETLQKLLDSPRLPEVLYRYTRFHLEATIAFLRQMDEKYDIQVIDNEEVQNCVEQIKMLLPADDQSHFTLGSNSNEGAANEDNDIDSLWARFDKLEDDGLDDKSAEGQELRTSIKEYIEDNNLGIKVTRSKSNQTLLEEIEKSLAGGEDTEEEEEEPKAKRKQVQEPEPEEEEDDEESDEPAEEPAEEENEEDEDEEEEESSRHSRRHERNDDTNEPAERPSRRGARPSRRR